MVHPKMKRSKKIMPDTCNHYTNNSYVWKAFLKYTVWIKASFLPLKYFLHPWKQQLWIAVSESKRQLHGTYWAEGASQVSRVVKNPPADAKDVRDAGQFLGSRRFPGGGHGNPLQYSCLENPKDRGAWWARVHRSQRVGHDWSHLARTHACTHTELNSLLNVFSTGRQHHSPTSMLKSSGRQEVIQGESCH